MPPHRISVSLFKIQHDLRWLLLRLSENCELPEYLSLSISLIVFQHHLFERFSVTFLKFDIIPATWFARGKCLLLLILFIYIKRDTVSLSCRIYNFCIVLLKLVPHLLVFILCIFTNFSPNILCVYYFKFIPYIFYIVVPALIRRSCCKFCILFLNDFDLTFS